jgi:hypothetical protein
MRALQSTRVPRYCARALTVARMAREELVDHGDQQLHDAEADDENVAPHHPGGL